LNDLAAWGGSAASRAGRSCSTPFSSFGGEELEFERWNLAACASTANKCLHGAPGIAFVLGPQGPARRPSHASTLYLDLARYRKEQKQGGRRSPRRRT
jgi:2-aminoethylphosphonate-pyruvate transaminase